MGRVLKFGYALLAVLVIALLLVLAFPGKLSAPKSGTKSQQPTETISDNQDSHAPEGNTPPADEDKPAQPDNDTQVTPNDPLSGTVRLRVIDNNTDEPLANTRCELLNTASLFIRGTDKQTHNFEWPWRDEPVYVTTDAQGEVEVPAVQVAEEEVRWYSDDKDAIVLKDLGYPLPDGYRPITTIPQLEAALRVAAETPTADAIEIRVTPMGRIHGQVTAPDGTPVEGVRLTATIRAVEGTEWAPLEPSDTGRWSWWEYIAPARNRVESLSIAALNEVRIVRQGHIADEANDRFVQDVSPPAITDSDGWFSFPAWQGEWYLGTRGGGYESAIAEVRHGLDDTRVDLRLGGQLSNLTLTLNLHETPFADDDWYYPDEEDEQYGEIAVRIETLNPLTSPYMSATQESFYLIDFEVNPVELKSARFQVDNLPPVWLTIEVWWGPHRNHERVRLMPGQSRELVMDFGDGMLEVDFVGLLPDEHGAEITVERPPALYQQPVFLPADEGFRAPLPPGDYVARLAGCPPTPFTISPGLVTQISLEPQLNTVEFHLHEALAASMGGAPTLTLNALASSPAASAIGVGYQPGLYWQGEVANGGLSELEFQDGSISLQLPPGVYVWTLLRGDIAIAAPIDLRQPTGPVVFRDDSLPGLARLDVDLSNEPEARISVTAGPKGNYGIRTDSFPPGGVIPLPDKARAIVWAEPGQVELRIAVMGPPPPSRPDPEGDLPPTSPDPESPPTYPPTFSGPLDTWRVEVTTPGTYHLPAMKGLHRVGVHGTDTGPYRVTVRRMDTLHRMRMDSRNTLWLPDGEYELEFHWRDARRKWRGRVDGPLILGPEDLAEHEPEHRRGVSLIWSIPAHDGRFDPSAPEPDRDLILRMAGVEPAIYRRVDGAWIRDRDFSGYVRPLHFDGTLEFLFGATLKPGHYRVVPWHGAPAAVVHEFVVPEEPNDEGLQLDITLD
jgi:hypothetical protein